MVVNQEQRPNLFQRAVHRIASSRAGAWAFARTLHVIDGPVMRRFDGWCPSKTLGGIQNVVMVTTTGARSGEKRSVPLIALAGPRGELALAASNWGQSHHPAWYHNMKANPEVEIEIDGEAHHYRAREATEEERRSYLNVDKPIAHLYSAYQQYAGDRAIPVMILQPVGEKSPPVSNIE